MKDSGVHTSSSEITVENTQPQETLLQYQRSRLSSLPQVRVRLLSHNQHSHH